MKIISWNVNGIRACVNKGFLDYLQSEEPDILCLQESKAQIEQLSDHILNPSGYFGIWHSAQKKGYSGVATLIKKNLKPLNVVEGLGIEKYDSEGRVLQTEFENFVLFNVYFPNGQMNEKRLQYKLDFYQELFTLVNDLKSQGKNIIICGDYNIAHTEIDLAHPKANENYSGFLPIERAWLDKIIKWGYVDTFRHFHKEPENYTWWSYRAGARRKNVGWRIDYFFVNKEFLLHVKATAIQQDVLGSDHCPVKLEFLTP
ncbi:exodeoxyribonuclease III [bacterium]|nr:exodeoxyribonuclease III [bacterium]MBT3580806.1 exodeoxyribonuclease III [bacterium]MBT7088258.1 exodeoxyribonuclease III [bacterium]